MNRTELTVFNVTAVKIEKVRNFDGDVEPEPFYTRKYVFSCRDSQGNKSKVEISAFSKEPSNLKTHNVNSLI